MKLSIRTVVACLALATGCSSDPAGAASGSDAASDIPANSEPDAAADDLTPAPDTSPDVPTVQPDIDPPLELPEPEDTEGPDLPAPADSDEPGEIDNADAETGGCQTQCDGKNCGSDGCGGQCGYCNSEAPVCLEGVCQEYCSTCGVTGKVYAPEGKIPIRGALVWATQTAPEPFPQQVFCDTCVDLPTGTPHGISSATGEFLLPIPTAGEWLIVVQKGTFRKVTKVTIVPGAGSLAKEVTTLPGKSDPTNGFEIPRMAVVSDSFDLIENTLAKLGLADVDSFGTLEAGTENFDLIDSDEADSFFADPGNLAQYHIIFMPCDSDWFFPDLEKPAVQEAVRQYVQAGGRLYVTDWSYSILKALFPDPIQWLNDDGEIGSAQLSSSFDGDAQVNDAGLKSWLNGQGIEKFDLEANWTIIEGVSNYTAPDVDGTPTTMKPKVWMNVVTDEGSRPATVSFQYGCGRGLFSTYHTEAGETLLPQEKTLAYILLEVALCADTKYDD